MSNAWCLRGSSKEPAPALHVAVLGLVKTSSTQHAELEFKLWVNLETCMSPGIKSIRCSLTVQLGGVRAVHGGWYWWEEEGLAWGRGY